MPAPAPLRFSSAGAIAAGLLLAAPHPVVAQPTASEAAPSDELDARIGVLERELAADEALLADYLTDADAARRLREAGELDAIAERLPRHQEELRALRARRAGGGGADAP